MGSDANEWVLRAIPIGAPAGKPRWFCLAPRGSPVVLTDNWRGAQTFPSKAEALAHPTGRITSHLFCPDLKADAAKGGPLRSYDDEEDFPRLSSIRRALPSDLVEEVTPQPAPKKKSKFKSRDMTTRPRLSWD